MKRKELHVGELCRCLHSVHCEQWAYTPTEKQHREGPGAGSDYFIRFFQLITGDVILYLGSAETATNWAHVLKFLYKGGIIYTPYKQVSRFEGI